MRTKFWLGSLKGRYHSDSLCIYVGIILKGIGGVDCIYMAQNMDQWRALVNVRMNFRVSQKAWHLLMLY
jgi:hypothetical protein